MKNQVKAKLKRRGEEIYLKYFFNPDNVINEIIKLHDNKEVIPDEICEVIFNIPLEYKSMAYELILYYPKKLKELKHIDIAAINKIYVDYGETINIMKEIKCKTKKSNVRGKITQYAQDRSHKYNIICDITSEDVKLVRKCPLLNIPLEYGNDSMTDYSASLDRIIPEIGYTKNNVQIISVMANKMKSNASVEQLKIFATNILKIY